MTHNNYIYILVVAVVTYLIRVLPLTLIRREIKNRFLRSFLYYVPYVTLAAMTFPPILHATRRRGRCAPAGGADRGRFGRLVQREFVLCGRCRVRGGLPRGNAALIP